MALPATDLVGFAGPQLEAILCALSLPYKIHRLAVVLHDCPIRVLFTAGGIDLEPRGALDE